MFFWINSIAPSTVNDGGHVTNLWGVTIKHVVGHKHSVGCVMKANSLKLIRITNNLPGVSTSVLEDSVFQLLCI